MQHQLLDHGDFLPTSATSSAFVLGDALSQNKKQRAVFLQQGQLLFFSFVFIYL
jgi:hypothetical protein